MNHEYFNDLKKYIDDSLANFEKIKSDVNISAEEKTTLLYCFIFFWIYNTLLSY
jgi:hypothetical protein